MKEKSIREQAFLSQAVRKQAAALTTAYAGGSPRKGESLRPGSKNLREWELRIGLLRRAYRRLEETMKALGEASTLKTKDAFFLNSHFHPLKHFLAS